MTDPHVGADVPKVGFSWVITLGNVLTIVGMAGGLLVGYMALATDARAGADAAKKLPVIEQQIAQLTTTNALLQQSLDTGTNARLLFQQQMITAISDIAEDRKDQLTVNTEILQKLAGIIARLDERKM